MPNLPVYQQQVDATYDRAPGNLIPNDSDPNAFGAGVGKAMQGLGSALGMDAEAVDEIDKKQKREAAANSVASFDFTPTELKLRSEVGPDGAGYHDKAVNAFKQSVDDHVNQIEDADTRQLTRQRLMAQQPTISGRTAEWEYQARITNGKLNADDALNIQQNKTMADPYSYDNAVQASAQVIQDNVSIPPEAKASMAEAQKYNLGKARFDGMLSRAKSIQDLDGIATDLVMPNPNDPNAKDWSTLLKPTDYHTIVEQIGSARKSMQEKLNSAADAQLTTLGSRVKDVTSTVGSDELQAAQQAVAATNDINRYKKMARITRDNTITATNQRLPPSELRAQINAANGDPGAAYPDLPPEVSTMINHASAATGMDVGYLGGLTTLEYGSEYKKAKVNVDKSFTPQLLNSNLDMRNFSPAAINAVTLAGQQLGQPLQITQGTGANVTAGAGQQVDISTLGKSPEDKAKIVGALVDGGMTAVAEYPDFVRVAAAPAVNANFGEKDGQAWGGWTNLSPEVAKVLKDRGFAAGATSDIIKRSLAQQPSVDYSVETNVVDENGKPMSSAVGAAQFTKGTWLDLIKKPGVAQMMGIDITGKSDDDLLGLRKNPQLSMIGAAIYGQQNKSILQNTLGRPVDNAEVYMAHLLGPAGAVTFLNGYKNQPGQAADQLMPQAAKNNPGLFYTKGQPNTVSDVYNRIANQFSLSPTQVMFEDNEQRKRLLENSTKELNDDPMSHAARVGSHNILPLDAQNGFATRGSTALAVSQYYGLPATTMKPFTVDEADAMKKQLDDGGADRAIQIMAQVQSMGPQVSQAAMAQLDEKDAAFGYAGRVYLSGNKGVAADILRGRDQLKTDPAIRKDMGIDDANVSGQFNSVIGTSLSDVPRDRAAIREAAVAYWVQHNSTGKKMNQLDSSFADAIHTVLGGTKDGSPVGDVHGIISIAPQGSTSDDFEGALKRMTLSDYTRLSTTGTAPLLNDGRAVNPDDIRNDVMPVPIGGGKYKLMLDDGKFLWSGTYDRNGQAVPYTMSPTSKDLKDIGARPYAHSLYDRMLDWAADQ